MIPVIYRKADYLKTLQYVLGKEEAQVIDTNLGGSKVSEFNKQFLVNKSIKPDIKKPCAHLILSIANHDAVHESLSDEQWASVAKRYLQELEYLPKEQNGVPSQYIAVRHRDREHEHVHIIASQVRFDGTKVNDSFDYFKAQTATRLIAHEMGLEVTPTSSKAVSNKLTEYGIDADVSDNRSKSIRSVKYKGNKVAAKDVIKNVLFEAIDKSNNMSEFLNNIESKEVYPIIKLDKERQILGFAYTHKGVTMAANQVNKKLSWGRFKNSLKFDIERSDLRLILSSKRKALADISKYKNKPNSDSGGDNSNSQGTVTPRIKDSKKSYVSVVPSVEDIFPSPSKKSKESKPTENSKPAKEKTPAPESTNNKKSYVSVVPSIEDVFPSPTKQNNNASKDEKFKTTQPSNVVEPTPQVTSSDNNISIDRVGDAIRTVAAYMAFVDKTQIDGNTLSARLDDNNNSLVIKDIQSEDTLVEAEYSTQTNQWDIKKSELLTETHLKRIAKLQEKLPTYKMQVENNRSGQER